MSSFATSLVSKIVRWAVGLLCAFLAGHDFGNASSLILAHTPEITSSIIGILLTFGPDVWIHVVKSKAFLAIKQRFGLPSDATPAQVAALAIKAANIAETATQRPLIAITNPAPIFPASSDAVRSGVVGPIVLCMLCQGCAASKQQVAVQTTAQINGVVTNVVADLPAGLVDKLQAFGTDHAQMVSAFSKALDDAANGLGFLPSPEELDTFLLWTAFDAKWSVAAKSFEVIYATWYPTVTPTATTLHGLATVLRNSTTPKPVAVSWIARAKP